MSAVLALSAVFVSVCAIRISIWSQGKFHRLSTQLQKDIHNRDVKLALHQKVLEIYNTACDCVRLLDSDDTILFAKLGWYFSSRHIEHKLNKIIEHRDIIERLLNEAYLLFASDEPLKKCFLEIRNDYLSLSARYIDLTQKARAFSSKAITIISKEFPELGIQSLYDLDKIINHQQACQRFDELLATDELKKFFEEDLRIYKGKFSFETFDNLFKKHLILDTL
ncbi:MAG: hypothetical protein FWG50_02575 [Kiritimatiellaeota bacterium]|nr:hypothetical protein [Kiritimatiellota bacterium]